MIMITVMEYYMTRARLRDQEMVRQGFCPGCSNRVTVEMKSIGKHGMYCWNCALTWRHDTYGNLKAIGDGREWQ
jgi:hypothetical protein